MKPRPFSISKYLPVLFLLVFLSFFAHLGNIPLFDADEGVYSEVTREMLANKDFTTPLLNGQPFFHKPPLFYWAQASSINFFGLNEFGLRLPSAIAALLWVVSIFLFARRYYDTRTAWHGTIFMASSLLVILTGRAATPAAMLNLFVTLTLLNIYRFYHTGNKRHVYWSFMFAGLGVLTKGSFAMLLPLAVCVMYFGTQKQWRNLQVLLFNPVGLIVFGLIVIPWYLAEFMRYGEAFLSDFILFQWSEPVSFIGSSLPYFFFIGLLFVGLLPYTALFIKALFLSKNLFADDLLKFMIIWFVLSLLLMPLATPKSILSLSYCATPLFIIMARINDDLRYAFNIFIWPIMFMTFLFVTPLLAPYIMGSIDNDFARIVAAEGVEYFDSYYLITIGALIFLLVALPFIRPVSLSVKYGISGLLFVSLTNFLILPIMGNMLQMPIKSAGLLTKKEKFEVVTWKINSPSFNVYAEMLSEHRAPNPGEVMLTKTIYLGNDILYEKLYEKHGIVLAKTISIQQ